MQNGQNLGMFIKLSFSQLDSKKFKEKKEDIQNSRQICSKQNKMK